MKRKRRLKGVKSGLDSKTRTKVLRPKFKRNKPSLRAADTFLKVGRQYIDCLTREKVTIIGLPQMFYPYEVTYRKEGKDKRYILDRPTFISKFRLPNC